MKKAYFYDAFTLIELLVVMAIIGLLAALLFPVLHSARNQAKKDVCLSNLRQLGSAIVLYAQDYDDKLPYAADRNTKALVVKGIYVYGSPLDDLIKAAPDIQSVLKSYGADTVLFRCPQDQNTLPNIAEDPPHKSTWYEESGSSYQYTQKRALYGQTLGGFTMPSESFLMGDYSYFHGGASGADGLANLLFADVHVKTVTWQQRSKVMGTAL